MEKVEHKNSSKRGLEMVVFQFHMEGISVCLVIQRSDPQEVNKTSEPSAKTRKVTKMSRKQTAGNVVTYSRGKSS